MPCKNRECEFDSKLRRSLRAKLSRDELRYGQLWSEVELPKLLASTERDNVVPSVQNQ